MAQRQERSFLAKQGYSQSCFVDMDRVISELKYAGPLLNASGLPLLFFTLAVQQKHSTRITPLFQGEYDHTVVGDGAGRSVVASRLSEKPCVNILLLEAGKSPPFLTKVPALARSFVGTDIDWKYLTAPRNFTAFHGFSGPVTVKTPPYDSELRETVNLAAFGKGIPAADANGRQRKDK